MINSTITDSLFESIEDAFKKPERAQSNVLYKEILKNEPGKSIYVRLLPNVKNPKQTYYSYGTYEFISEATGTKKFYYSPSANIENGVPAEECRDPIGEWRRRIWKSDEATARKVKYNSFRLVNVYVVKDEVNPENNGKVKILKINKTLWTKIEEQHKDEDGKKRIYDLGAEGRTFKIATTLKGEYWNFDTSGFTLPKAIPELQTQAKIDEVYASMFDLSTIHRVSDVEYITKLLNEHILVNSASADAAPAATTQSTPKKEVKSNEKSNATVASGDESVDDILKSIGVI